jgi:hypothetical protein
MAAGGKAAFNTLGKVGQARIAGMRIANDRPGTRQVTTSAGYRKLGAPNFETADWREVYLAMFACVESFEANLAF